MEALILQIFGVALGAAVDLFKANQAAQAEGRELTQAEIDGILAQLRDSNANWAAILAAKRSEANGETHG